MPETTGISWTDATWNPWRGCTKVSPGCAHCYMFRDQERYGRDPSVVVRAAPATFGSPLKWADPKLIFTCSWSDWFHEDADAWRDDAWDVVRRSPQHTFQILTKRPELVADRLPADWDDGWPNVWIGVSIENARHTWRADVLRGIPAALRFISAEPLLGSLYPTGLISGESPDAADALRQPDAGSIPAGSIVRAPLDLSGIDWIIVGGESGSKKDARPMHAAWVREIRDAVMAVSINDEPADATRLRPAFHFKQWGSWTTTDRTGSDDGVWLLPDGTRHSSFDADAFGVDLSGACRVRYAGPLPTAGGKFLDGTDWCEIPDSAPPKQLTLA